MQRNKIMQTRKNIENKQRNFGKEKNKRKSAWVRTTIVNKKKIHKKKIGVRLKIKINSRRTLQAER